MTTKVTGSILANTAVTAGRYGGAATVGTFTVDAQGRLIDSGNTTIAITSSNLDTTGVSASTYGSTSSIPQIVVDSKGRITSAANVSITQTSIYANTGQLVANAATGVVQIGLATSGANPGNYGSGTTVPIITVDATGRITSVSATLITGGSAGTGSTTFNRNTRTATAGQTLFSSVPHTVGYLQVYLNGVLLTPNDYTANASNSAVVLTQACSVGDQFEAFAYTTTLANNLSPGTTGGGAGTVLYQSAANTTSNTAVGTSGYFLTSAGVGQPTWTGYTGSGTVVLSTAPTITGTTSIASAYSPNLTLTDAATVAWDVSQGQVATFTFVSSNRTMGTPTNLQNGGFYALAVIQNAGSNTLSWASVFKWTGGTAPTLSTTAGAKDYFVFRSDGTNLYEQGRSQAVA